MNCWEILGIDPTRDRAAIDRAYEQQKKFAAGEELERLQQAYLEASGQPPRPDSPTAPDSPPADVTPDDSLTAQEQQVVREVAIQVKALLNDSRRAADEGIWRAILTEPPADQPHIRAAVAESLGQQVRPMARNGSFPPSVVTFLADWFGWQELQEAGPPESSFEADVYSGETVESPAENESQPPVTNFWPAVVGWVVALAVLATIFDNIFGG